MSDVKVWALSLCSAGAASALFSLLSPDKAMGRMTKMVMGVFVLLCILSPLKLVDEFDFDDFSFDVSIPDVQQQAQLLQQGITREQIEGEINTLIYEKLAALGIIPSDIRIHINVSAESLDITEVQVTLSADDAQSADTVINELTDYLGLPVSVHMEEER